MKLMEASLYWMDLGECKTWWVESRLLTCGQVKVLCDVQEVCSLWMEDDM